MQILQTRDYTSFKRLPGNRQLHKPHLARLKQSIEVDPSLAQTQPILVNERMEVIDGQHRLSVLEELGEPVSYIKVEQLRLGDVQTLNTLAKPWGPIDYAKSFVELGNDNYQFYLDLKNNYHLPHRVLTQYITMKQTSAQASGFQRGELVAANRGLTIVYLDRLMDMGRYYNRFTTAAFAGAFLKIVSNPSYDHDRMMAKMRIRGHKIEDFSLTEDYERALEAVYNFKNRDRVRFF